MSQATLSAVTPPDLLGQWRLRRRIVDRHTVPTISGARPLHGTVDGVLTLASGDGQITWSESGVLHWQGTDVAVTRAYLLRPTADGWWLYFADGRPFHPWQPGGWVEHPCRDDLYRGLVSVSDSGRWGTIWDVTGPAKALRIVTRLRRAVG